jgi:hypothetical protein
MNLKDITICSIDCVTPDMAAEAINISSRKISFGDAILFSNKVISGQFRSVEIPNINSREEYSKFVIESLIDYVDTQFVLIVQWDGYVTAPHSWEPSFLDYDYIGARWPWHKDGLSVGNGGFSLRSKKLMQEFLGLKADIDYSLNEDEIICRAFRSELEKKNITFASVEIADKFSYERELPDIETFGFHGFFNMWRHCDDSRMMDLVANLGSGTYLSIEYLELMITYLQQKKFSVYKNMYTHLIKQLGSSNIQMHLSHFIKDTNFVNHIINVGNGS